MVEELATMSEALRKSEQGRANASYLVSFEEFKRDSREFFNFDVTFPFTMMLTFIVELAGLESARSKLQR